MAEGAIEDPFGEYLEQEPATGGYSPTAAAATSPDDAAYQLRLLAESSRRQEQLLGKVCSLLVNLDEKLGAVANNQERLEVKMERMAEDGAFSGGGGGGGGATRRDSGSGRGMIVGPPGSRGAMPTAGPSGPSKEEVARQEAERIAAERSRIEAENARRAEELARKRVEAEKHAQEEAERQRILEEKRKEEERQRKSLLEKKTTGLMDDLVGGSGGGGGGLFGDDLPKKAKKGGGLFDDD